MSERCCAPPPPPKDHGGVAPGFRRALVIALVANATMFAVEAVAGVGAQSLALLADAIDFAGDAANYGLSLVVLSMAAAWRSRAAWVKGLCMTGYGVFVAGGVVWAALMGSRPEPFTMGLVAALALVVNLGVAWMLYAYREGDANMRSVWLCSRNDAIGNLAVIAAGFAVFGTDARWPDLVVAAVMATLAISAGASVIRQAGGELRTAQR